jgi:hypothetical protein
MQVSMDLARLLGMLRFRWTMSLYLLWEVGVPRACTKVPCELYICGGCSLFLRWVL